MTKLVLAVGRISPAARHLTSVTTVTLGGTTTSHSIVFTSVVKVSS